MATAGSCFAQHISRSLRNIGFNFYIADEPGKAMTDAESKRRNYGVFSARYGNIYTARQMLQLFQEAFAGRAPIEAVWQRNDGAYADAFRPQIEPDGFPTVEDLLASRRGHLAAVRHMIERMDVLIFTLGLTEAWCSRIDGSVYPLAPGVAAGSYDPERHRFVNFTFDEIRQDMRDLIEAMRDVNRHCKILLTVSPVPLIATFEPRHVLVSTTYSKSVLRVVAEETVRRFPGVDYFPSYEIITGSHVRGNYYEDDRREVSASGVEHAMRIFLQHYPTTAQPQAAVSLSASAQALASIRAASEVVCDEEIIELARG